MTEKEVIPEGAIPVEEFQAAELPTAHQKEVVPEGAIPVEEFGQAKYGSGIEQAKTAIEQGLSGATLGASKVFETKVLGVKPEDIKGRQEENPATSIASDILGTTALLASPFNVIGPVAKGLGTAGKLAVGGLEGAVIGGANQVSDQWSQNEALDAQKIAGSTGLGFVLGGVGSGIAQALKKYNLKGTSLSETTEQGLPDAIKGPEPKLGVQPTSLKEVAKNVEEAVARGEKVAKPQQALVGDALTRVKMKYPINPAQFDSLSGKAESDAYQIAKEVPDKDGISLKNYETLQKYHDLVPQLEETIQNVAPGYEGTTNEFQAGQRAAQAFNDALIPQRKELGRAVGFLKKAPIDQIDHLPGVIQYLVKSNNKVGNIFGENLSVKKWDPQMGISRKAHANIKEAIDSIKRKNPGIEGLFDIRKALEDGVNVLERGGSGAEIANARKAMLSYIQDIIQQVTPDVKVRETMANYAKVSDAIEFVEKRFGARIGTDEWRSLAKGKAQENILDRIFNDSATVDAAKQILPKEEFNKILSDYLNVAKETYTKNGEFSSNRFGSFLNKNQYGLQYAFQDSPETLQRVKDLTLLLNVFPDAAPVVVGSGKTILNRLQQIKLSDLTLDGLIKSIPKKALQGLTALQKRNELNKALMGQSIKNAEEGALIKNVLDFTNKLNEGVDSLFKAPASQSRKIH